MSTPRYQAGFLQRLKFEDEIVRQVAAVREAFNIGALVEIMNTVDALEDLVYGIPQEAKDEGIEGLEDYQEELERLNDEFEEKHIEKMKTYEDLIADAGCPDVIEKPVKIPDKNYFRLKFRAIERLLARNKLTILPKNIQHL